jgi:arylsulfatase
MPDRRPNIILVMTDQQRYDTIGRLGYPHMVTPNLDRLAALGMAFTNVFATAPSCVPSRASFFNMRYPLAMGVSRNASPWRHSWVESLQAAGYQTVNIGKMHTVPLDAPCGFDQRFIVENKDRPFPADAPHGVFLDEWDRHLALSGVRKPSRTTYRDEDPQYETALGAYEWPLEERLHPDAFVGDLARRFVETRRSSSPLFLQVGFPGPHPPYDPPRRHIELYDDCPVPVPEVTADELAGQTPAHRVLREVMIEGNHDAVRWVERAAPRQLQRLRRHYAANVTLIDEKVGELLAALQERGLLDNAIVVFMSDHGDALGDHGLIQKWSMYDCVLRLPVIVRWPGRLRAGSSFDGLLQHMDLAPLLLEAAGVPVPKGVDAAPLEGGLPLPRARVFAEHGRDAMYRDISLVSMVRTAEHKLVHYLDEPCGELYDLARDPGETVNLWGDASQREHRARLMESLVAWRFGAVVGRRG